MAEKAQTEYGGICGRDAFMARVDAFLHANDAAGYRAALALRRAGNENESDGTLCSGFFRRFRGRITRLTVLPACDKITE